MAAANQELKQFRSPNKGTIVNLNLEKMIFFFVATTVSTTPTLLELQRHVTPQYATDWREIGVELGLTNAKLREIEVNYPRDVKQCCNRMFSEWLRVDTTASWEKLFTAIESPAVSGDPVRGNCIVCTCIVCCYNMYSNYC